jgi:hypothetical protein
MRSDWAFETMLQARRERIRDALAGRQVTALEAFRALTGREAMGVGQAAYVATVLAGIAKPVAQDTWSVEVAR